MNTYFANNEPMSNQDTTTIKYAPQPIYHLLEFNIT